MAEHPKIGIRPIIDGRRRGVRESLEDQTMGMAQRLAKLYTDELHYIDGEPVECVIADTTIGGVSEAIACQKKFDTENVGLTVSVTPCWCYGTETLQMDTRTPHAIWGFNGTERPGAVYLAAALAGLAVAQMRGEAYLSMGSVAMGIAGSTVKDEFFGPYLGMRNEYIDMSEFYRRINEKIYDEEEYEKALKWMKENFTIGKDYNPEKNQHPERHEDWWETCAKMVLIGHDLMKGNPKLAEKGWAEEAGGHGAIAAGFQGQRQWTDGMPNGDVMETVLNTNFDWNGARQPVGVVATENDSLNGASMLFGYLLTNTPQIFSDVRTYWSPESVKRVTGYELEGHAKDGFLDLRNSGWCRQGHP